MNEALSMTRVRHTKCRLLAISVDRLQSAMSPNLDVLTATADDLQRELSSTGGIDSKQLVKIYLSQIERHNDYLNAVVSTAPESLLLERASMLDDERQRGKLRSPLHGIPILIKDNIATHPSTGLDTTAGSLALVNSSPRSNAPIVDRVSRCYKHPFHRE